MRNTHSINIRTLFYCKQSVFQERGGKRRKKKKKKKKKKRKKKKKKKEEEELNQLTMCAWQVIL